MTMHNAFDIVLVLLAAAVVVVAVFRWLNLPPVLGYLLVGAVLGPHAAGIVPNSEQARYLGEFGVVFLMFSIGLEFSLPRLFAMKRIVFGLGSVQVGVTIVVLTLLGKLVGLGWGASLALGSALAMSSTAILSKLLADRSELETPHGRQVIGVLLFQDVAVVPLLILLPALSQPANVLAETLTWAALKTLVVLTLVLFLGHRLMRPLFHFVARRKSSELFILNVLLVTLGMAWLTELAGLSLALGAFLAGMLISETEYRYQVEEDIKPFRDVLLGLFMVTVGMFLDVHVLVTQLPWVLLTLTVFLALKFGVIFGAIRAFGEQAGTAVRSGLWLCVGGEFGFVLLTLASESQLVPESFLQIVVAALVLSMLLAPLLVLWSDRIVLRFVASEWLLRSMQLTKVAAQSIATERHVIICGYGRSGQYLARFLEQENVSYMALDLDPDRVREAAVAGDSVVFGDSARRETLVAAGVLRASAVVVSFNDMHATQRVIAHVQALRPDVPIIVRAADENDMERLIEQGAAEVVPEMLETSVMLATHTLALIGVPLSRVIRRTRDIRMQRYGMIRGFFHGASDAAESPEAQQERLQSIVLHAGAWAVGRRIADIDFGMLGVNLNVLRRKGVRNLEPAQDMTLESGDVLVLLGVPANLALAELRLLKGG